MIMISSRLHGIWDYLVAALLIATPFIFGFAGYNWATYAPFIVAFAILGTSIMTNYEYSLAKIIPLPIHLMLDMGAAVFLAASPWIFNFADMVYVPHVAAGILEFFVATMTVKKAYTISDIIHPRGNFGNSARTYQA